MEWITARGDIRSTAGPGGGIIRAMVDMGAGGHDPAAAGAPGVEPGDGVAGAGRAGGGRAAGGVAGDGVASAGRAGGGRAACGVAGVVAGLMAAWLATAGLVVVT
ncbi:hypothetical protein [Micromonospora sp. MW-13]|uniref:hypothetical protein n=1 Tax=Micromonospora sp. MW-13 TaxID=2094022 RepID=UPI000FFF53A6|nr:hypothetical protein [Micromonospora sp. MW-13]